MEAENSDLRLQLQHSKPLEEDYEEHGIINILLVWYMLYKEAYLLNGDFILFFKSLTDGDAHDQLDLVSPLEKIISQLTNLRQNLSDGAV